MDEETKDVIVNSIVIIAVILFVGTIMGWLAWSHNEDKWDREMRKFAIECYHAEEDITGEVRRKTATASYLSSKEAIVVEVICGKRTYEHINLNKTRLFAGYLGKRFKQAKEGFAQGLKDETKFKENTDE